MSDSAAVGRPTDRPSLPASVPRAAVSAGPTGAVTALGSAPSSGLSVPAAAERFVYDPGGAGRDAGRGSVPTAVVAAAGAARCRKAPGGAGPGQGTLMGRAGL